MMVFLMNLEMFIKVINSLCENSNLNFRRTCVSLMSSVSFDNSSFFFFTHHDKFTSLKYFSGNKIRIQPQT